MKKHIISALSILLAVFLSACSFAEQEEAFTPDTVHLTQMLSSTFPSVSITDPETVTHLWGLYQGIEFDGTKDKLDKENAWSLAITFTDSKNDKYELITIFAGGLCWLGEDYETLHVIKNGSNIYDEFLTNFEDFSEKQSYFDAKN